jgi:hypothetical protein
MLPKYKVNTATINVPAHTITLNIPSHLCFYRLHVLQRLSAGVVFSGRYFTQKEVKQQNRQAQTEEQHSTGCCSVKDLITKLQRATPP